MADAWDMADDAIKDGLHIREVLDQLKDDLARETVPVPDGVGAAEARQVLVEYADAKEYPDG